MQRGRGGDSSFASPRNGLGWKGGTGLSVRGEWRRRRTQVLLYQQEGSAAGMKKGEENAPAAEEEKKKDVLRDKEICARREQ